MSKLDELKNRERELLYQLEDNGKENYRTKELIETFEGYDRASLPQITLITVASSIIPFKGFYQFFGAVVLFSIVF